jgi:high-affinity Fe2+/Pb2+ permease
VVGAAALAVRVARWWRRTPAAAGDAPRRSGPVVWGAVVAAGVPAGVLAALRADGLRAAAFAAATTGGAAAIAAVLVVAVVWHRRTARVQDRAHRPAHLPVGPGGST